MTTPTPHRTFDTRATAPFDRGSDLVVTIGEHHVNLDRLCRGIFIASPAGSGRWAYGIEPVLRQVLAHKAHDKQHAIGGLILTGGAAMTAAGELLHQVGRGDDHRPIGVDDAGDWCWNPLNAGGSDYELARGLAAVMAWDNDPFFAQASTSYLRFVIRAYRAAFGHVTLSDIHDCARDPKVLEWRLEHEGGSAELDGCRRWYSKDWTQTSPTLRRVIEETITTFLAPLDDPRVRRVLCPPTEAFEPTFNTLDGDGRYLHGQPLASFDELIDAGIVVTPPVFDIAHLRFNRGINALLKLDFQRAIYRRTRFPKALLRPALFVSDEHETLGVGDEDRVFLAGCRPGKCIAIVGSAFAQEDAVRASFQELLDVMRSRIFLSATDATPNTTVVTLETKE